MSFDWRTPLRQLSRQYNVLPCPVCRHGDGGGDNELCPDCRAQLWEFAAAGRCHGCGGPLEGVLAYCPRCLPEPKRPFSDAVSLFAYRDLGLDLIWQFKRNCRVELAHTIIALIADWQVLQNWDCEIIVPMPLYWLNYWLRGFNQAELLAGQLGGKLALPVVAAALRRVKRTRKQKELSGRDRHRNLQGAFAAVPKLVKDRRILLVDDVFTTGASLSVATAALLDAGAADVKVFTAARTL